MHSRTGLEWTFDTVSAAYEKFRPGYVEELYRAIFSYAPIEKSSRVLEIGSGAGQATLPVLKTGCYLISVECGEHFSQLLRDKFKEYSKFSVIARRFEDADLGQEPFDLIFSASAFHWIPEKAGYEKVYSLLKKGGVFARFANHPYRSAEQPALAEDIDEIYKEYYYKFHNKEPKASGIYTEQQARDIALLAQKYGFSDIQYALFYRQRVFSAEEYVALMGTYSDHIAIEKSIREKFFSKIEDAIDRHGGTITICDTMDLQLARKE